MKNKTTLYAGLLLVGIGFIVAILAIGSSNNPPQEEHPNGDTVSIEEETKEPTKTPAVSGNNRPSGSEGTAPSSTRNADGLLEVVYTDAGFSPFVADITAGESVAFVNKSSKGLWVKTTTESPLIERRYDAFDTGRTLSPGERWVFTFTQLGTWGYKNLNNQNHKGAVAVQPQH